MSAAEELCTRAFLERDENKVAQRWNSKEEQDGKSKKENERKKSIMKERGTLRNRDQGERIEREFRLWRTSVWWPNGTWKINNQKIREGVRKTQNMLDKTDIRLMADHLDLFQHIDRDWNEKADRRTHEAREKGASWNSFAMKEGSKLEAARAYFDGGISKQEDRKVKQKVGSAYVFQASERIEEAAEKMEWKTQVEVSKVVPDDATITQAETSAALEAARAICCLVQTVISFFHLGWTFHTRYLHPFLQSFQPQSQQKR